MKMILTVPEWRFDGKQLQLGDTFDVTDKQAKAVIALQKGKPAPPVAFRARPAHAVQPVHTAAITAEPAASFAEAAVPASEPEPLEPADESAEPAAADGETEPSGPVPNADAGVAAPRRGGYRTRRLTAED